MVKDDWTVVVLCNKQVCVGYLFFSAGVHPALGAEAAWWCQKEEEEVLHHPQEEQAQEEEGQARCAQILQGINTGAAKRPFYCLSLLKHLNLQFYR